MTQKIAPFIELIRGNQNFRRLWIAQIISNFGDWFGLLAVYALIQKHSGSELLLGLIIVVKMLSLAFSSPFAGFFTDRFNRRQLMILSDVMRGILVLGFILIVSSSQLWLAYLITALQMVFSAIFEPAKTSSIPNVTTSEELVNANILSAASWSIIFTTGMAIGGFATAALGTTTVFVINSATYLISGLFIYRAVIPQKEMSKREKYVNRNPLHGIAEGFIYLKNHPQVRIPVFAKATFSISLGALVYMLIIVSEEVLLMGSIGLGILYAARGIGTGVGPVLGRRLFKREEGWIRAIGFFMILTGCSYLLASQMQSLLLIALFVMLAHMTSGSNWVFSTVLLQRRAPDKYRGRVFSTEWLLFTLFQSVSVTMASLLLEYNLLQVQQAMALFSLILAATGIFWLIRVAPAERVAKVDQSSPAVA